MQKNTMSITLFEREGKKEEREREDDNGRRTLIFF